MASQALYGILAEFDSAEAVLDAAKRARADGYRDLDAFTPFPVHGLADVLEIRDNRILWLGLGGAIFGAVLALGMQAFTNYSFPIVVGGKPIYAISAFMVVTFELTILFGALTPAIGMLALNGLPRLNYPVFSSSRFHLASRDRFFLCIHAADPGFDADQAEAFLKTLHHHSIERVPA